MKNFISFLDSQTTLLIVYVGAGLIALIVILCLLNHFVFKRNRIKKICKELDRKYNYLHTLLTGQDSQYIKRLEIISRTNLLYVEKYNDFSKKFRQILDNDDQYVQSLLTQFKSLIEHKQYKKIPEVIQELKKTIRVLDDNINQLDNELAEVHKPEEEARHNILYLKESYRNLKSTYSKCENDIEIVTDTFKKVFVKLDAMFSEFEDYLESGEYDEANTLSVTIKKVVESLNKVLEQLPSLCLNTMSIIPNKINELSEKYLSLEKQGIPLFNLSFKKKLAVWTNELSEIQALLVEFKLNGIAERINLIENEIQETNEMLDKETADKEDFNISCDELYKKVVELEKNFVRICQKLPEVREIYVVSSEQEAAIKKLSESITSLGGAKRTLDNYINSSTPQPYSVLKDKLVNLQLSYDSAFEGMQDFRAYLDNLRKCSEDAYDMIFAYFYQCEVTEKKIRDIAIPSFTEKYQIQIDNCYSLLNNLDIVLKTKPLDVNKINEMVDELKHTGNICFDNVDTKFKEMQLAESSIVYGNRDRGHQTDIHQQYLLLESLFFEGEFNKVHEEAINIYNSVHADTNQISK